MFLKDVINLLMPVQTPRRARSDPWRRRAVLRNPPARGALKPGNSLIVVTPFLPSPLVEKLNSEGSPQRSKRQLCRLADLLLA
jgi:hypothetical protein